MTRKVLFTTLILGIALCVNAQNHYSYRMVKLDSTYDANIDPKLEKYVNRQKAALDLRMNEVIGQCDRTLNSFSPMSPLSNFLTDLLLSKASLYTNDEAFSQCDIAMLNFGGIRAQLSAGDVTVGNIYALSPFDNYLVFIELKGSELKKALQRFRAGTADAPLAGAQITYQGNYPTKILVNGEKIDNDRIYKLVTVNFIAEGGDKLLSDIRYERTLYTGTIFRDFLLEQIREMTRRGETITAQNDNRVVVLPTP